MVAFKLVVSDKEMSYARDVADPQSAGFLGKRIGETVGGELIGLPGYTFRIAGGTDRSGFPMRPEMPGARQTRLFVGNGFGFHAPRVGQRRRRTYRGNTVSEETVQINLVVEKKGPGPIAEAAPAS